MTWVSLLHPGRESIDRESDATRTQVCGQVKLNNQFVLSWLTISNKLAQLRKSAASHIHTHTLHIFCSLFLSYDAVNIIHGNHLMPNVVI